MRSRAVVLFFAFFAISLFGADTTDEAGSTGEQQPAAAPVATSASASEAPPPDAISVVDISIRANRLASELQATRSETVPDFVIGIAEGLPELQAAVEKIVRDVASSRSRAPGTRWLISIIEEIEQTEPDALFWQEELRRYAASLRDKIDKIDSDLTQWNETLNRVVKGKAPESVQEEIQTLIRNLESTEGVVRGRLESTLSLQSNLAAIVSDLAAAKVRTGELVNEVRSGLFRRDSVPIWRLFSAEGQRTTIGDDLRAYSVESMASIERYSLRKKTELGFLLALAVAGLIFLLRIRKRHAEALETNPRLETTAAIVGHPVAGAILLAVMATPILLVDSPEAFSRLISAFLLVPLLRFIPSLVRPGLRGLAYGSIGLFLAVRLGATFPEASGIARLLHLAAALFVLVGGISALRRTVNSPNRSLTIVVAVQISVAVSFASVVANVMGLAVLSSVLVQGVANSAFTGLALLLGVIVVSSMFRLLSVVGPLRHVRAIAANAALVDQQLDRYLILAATLYWALRSLEAFAVRSVVMDTIGSALGHEFRIGSLVISAGAVLTFIFAIWLAVAVSRLLRFFLEQDVLARLDLPRGVPSAVSKTIHYAIILLGLLVALAAAGINLSQISILVGALGVGIGFGLQNVVNNFVSGLIIIFERPLSIGDMVQFGTTIGEVRRIGIRSSTVRTFEGAEIIVPNGNLISNDLTNWTLSDEQRRIDVPVRVAYGNDPQRVLEILAKVARETENVEASPEPFLTFDGFGECSLDFTVRCWTSQFGKGARLKSALAVRIYEALTEADIEIPLPQRDLHLRTVPPGFGPKENEPSQPTERSSD